MHVRLPGRHDRSREPPVSSRTALTPPTSRRMRLACLPVIAAVAAAPALALTAVPAIAATTTGTTSAAMTSTPADGTWQRVYRNDFSDLRDVTRFTSSASVNGSLSPSDTTNNLLQKPTVASDVSTVSDPAAEDGSALGVFTQQASYATASGTAYGWTNGRMALSGQNQAPPVRIRARIRMTPSIGAKTAVMWWPAGGGWPWEVDFAETFGGVSLTDYWGGRQHVDQHWHADLNDDGAAKEQLNHTDDIDATRYHTYDLFVLPNRMWVEIDGVTTFETTDARWIPKGPGFFSIGKALTGTRSGQHTKDGVYVDWVEIYRIGTPSVTLDPITAAVGVAPSVTGTVGTGGGDTTYRVEYGPTAAYGASTPEMTITGGADPVPVSAQLSGLAPATTYHYRLVATNPAGSVSSPDATLTTGALPSAQASVVAMQPTVVTLSGAVSTGGLDTTAAVEYEAASGTPQVTSPVVVPGGGAAGTVTVPLTGLVPGAAYTYRALVSNAAGTVSGPTGSFVAPSAPAVAGPAVATRTSDGLTVRATVAPGNLPTSVSVEYGSTTAYGARSAAVSVPAGTDEVSLALPVSGLAAGTRYHLRVVAANAAGTVSSGDQLTGTTGAPVAAVGSLTRGTVSAGTASLRFSGSVRPNSLWTSYVLRYGPVWAPARTSTAKVGVGSGLWTSTVSRTLTGLRRHTCYRVTLLASNAAGSDTASSGKVCTG